MEFGVVKKTETHFADAETHIKRKKIYLFKGWVTCLDSRSYDRRLFEFFMQGDINFTFSAQRFVKRQKTKIPEEQMLIQ